MRINKNAIRLKVGQNSISSSIVKSKYTQTISTSGIQEAFDDPNFVDDYFLKGGYKVVSGTDCRNNIPCEYRKLGMQVMVVGPDASFKRYILKGQDPCSNDNWEEVSSKVEETDVKLVEDYSIFGANLYSQRDLNLASKQVLQNLQTQIDNIELTDEKVQITENTNFAQIGQNQKDFNKKVSDYKASSDLKNQEQDDRLENLEGEIDGKLNKPTTTSNTTSYPYVVGEDGNGNSARLPAGDLGKNFFNSDLSNTTARNHTMNAGVTVNTLGNPHTLSGLPNKNADIANFRKVRVQNASGLDSVVDSKNLLTDGMTSMTDAEKDAWRLAQRKTGETYSTGQPRIDFILPFKLSKNISGIQYFSCIGSNLLLNLSDCQVKLINTSTNAEYPISVVNTSASTTSQFSIGYDISSLPTGSYKIYVRNGFNINIDNTTFDVVDNIQYFDMSSITWQKNVLTSGDFTGSTAVGGNINRQSPNITGEPSTYVRKIEFLSSEILNSLEANGNFIIEIDFSRYRADVHNPSYLGLVDSTVNSLNGNGQIIFGWASLSSGGNRTTLFPTSVTAGGGSNLGQESGKMVISKKGSIIQMMAILSGTIYITTNISQSNSYTGLKLMYFDFGISSVISGSQQTYNIKLYK